MTPTPTIRTLAAHEWKIYKDLRLRALADSPEAFGTTLDEAQVRPDAYWMKRMAPDPESSWDLPLVAEVDGEPIGLTWGRIEVPHPQVANVYSVWVDPRYRQKGVGMMLMEAVIEWARSMSVRYVDLGVLYADSPAMRLYRRAGFEPVGDPMPLRHASDSLGLHMRLDLENYPPKVKRI